MDMYPGYLGLLKWSLAQQETKEGDEERPPPPEMSVEDRQFLDEVMKSITVDEAKRMSELADVLLKPDTAELVAEKEAALDELTERVESIDNARDLCVLGGLAPLRSLLTSRHPTLAVGAAETISIAVQNNAKVQQMALEGGLLHVLLPLAANTSGDVDAAVRSKAFLAVSSFVRHYPPALNAFLAADELAIVASAMAASSPERLQRRGLFFLRHLLASETHGGFFAAGLAQSGNGHLLAAVAGFSDSANVDLREDSWNVLIEFLRAGRPVEGAGDGGAAAALAAGNIRVHGDAVVAAGAGAGAGAGSAAPAASAASAPSSVTAPSAIRAPIEGRLSTPVGARSLSSTALMVSSDGAADGDGSEDTTAPSAPSSSSRSTESMPQLPSQADRVHMLRAAELRVHELAAARLATLRALPDTSDFTDELAALDTLQSLLTVTA